MDINLRIRLVYDHLQAGNIEQAIKLCEAILKDDTHNPYILELLGIIFYKTGDISSAIDYLRKAAGLNPSGSETFYNLGAALLQQKNYNEASECFRRVLQLTPDSTDARSKLASALLNKGQIAEAILHLKKTAEIAPTFVNFFNLGFAYHKNGQIDNAIACYKKVISINPDFSDAYNNLIIGLKERGYNEEADYFQLLQAEKLKGTESAKNSSGTHKSISNFLTNKWTECMTSIPVIYSNEDEIISARRNYKDKLTDIHTAISCADNEVIKDLAGYIGEHKPFYLAYQGMNDKELQKIYGASACKIISSAYPQLADRNFYSYSMQVDKIRIGFVSGYFYYHSVWKIPIKGWLENLDRDKFILYGYYTGRKKDNETTFARKCFHYFVEDIHDFELLCKRILNDRIHILVYPEIGMDPMTIKLASLKLAPVQCASWGHPETSGFPTIDYYLSSELMEPIDGSDHYTESLIRLPDLSVYYAPPVFPEIKMDRQSFGLRPASVLFHCCQSLYKFLPQYDEIFPRIAKEIGDCQFLFSSYPFDSKLLENFRSRIFKAFSKFNLDGDKFITFLPLLNPSQYQALNRLSDIFLDCIGWSGCNSVLEALSCNLPVITMPGELMRSREGSAILKKMELEATIANSLEEYIKLSVQLGKDSKLRHEISNAIAEKFHLVCNDKECITALEDFFTKIVKGNTDNAFNKA